MEEGTVLESLHKLGEPRRLFGESHAQRVQRYKKLTLKALVPTMTKGPIPTSLELVPEEEMKVSGTVPEDTEARRYLLKKGG